MPTASSERPKGYLRYSEVAHDHLHVTVRTVYSYVAAGLLERVRHGRHVWITERSVRALLAQREQEARADARRRRAVTDPVTLSTAPKETP